MTQRFPKPEQTPQFMHPQEFEDEAALRLAEYGKERGVVTAPPVPIDDIVEEYLKIAVELRDLRAEFARRQRIGINVASLRRARLILA